MAYKLQLPVGSKVHPIFHVSLLKRHVGAVVSMSVELPPLSIDGDTALEPKEVLDTRWIHNGFQFVQESLVLWNQVLCKDATWENSAELQSRFPTLNLEDKIPSKRGSNDRSPQRFARVPIKNKKYFD